MRNDAAPSPSCVPMTLWERLKNHPMVRIGPGLVTGVADDDPSGIATYSQAGAQFGLNMLWTMPLTFPLMAAIQSMCASIGRVTGKGIAANIKAQFPPAVLYGVVALLLVANVLNIAADVAAMGEVAELAFGFNRHVMTTIFVAATVLSQVLVPYHRYVSYLKWLALSLLAYAAVLFTVDIPWSHVALRTLWPNFTVGAGAASVVVGVFGTTISPYLFFWQASQEVEDMRQAAPLRDDAQAADGELRRIRWDTWTGMFYSNIAAYFIILATAVTLNVAGITRIDTAAQAASALRPLAGDFAFLLYALGILGTGLIGVPVLAGSGAYALAETFGWKASLEHRVRDARGFYGILAVSILVGFGIHNSPIGTMQALFWSAVLNGLVAVPLLVLILILATRSSVMGPFKARGSVVLLGWFATILMALAAVRMVVPD